MADEQQIRNLLRADLDNEPDKPLVSQALSRARRQVGQRDTIGFALVRIWAVLARLLAPFFARLGEQQARAQFQGRRKLRRGRAPEQSG